LLTNIIPYSSWEWLWPDKPAAVVQLRDHNLLLPPLKKGLLSRLAQWQPIQPEIFQMKETFPSNTCKSLLTCSRADHTCSSVCSSNGSRFLLRVPLNKIGFCNGKWSIHLKEFVVLKLNEEYLRDNRNSFSESGQGYLSHVFPINVNLSSRGWRQSQKCGH